ncbi:MAG: UDP-glucose 4-epimerase GalE [bacterium]|nr:UDP-glucose 4-epimerase GalE [bacterium]
MTKPRLLITGGTGYVGSFTARYLQDKYDILIIDNLIYGHKQAVPGLKVIKLDLSEYSRLEAVLADYQPTAIIHFAAYIQAGESVKNPAKYFVNNVGGSLNLLNAMASTGVDKIVFSSSAAVYGNPQVIPIPEDSLTQPINPYGESKLMVEKMMDWYAKAYGLNYISLRYFNACGAGPDGLFGEDHRPETHIIPLLIKSVLDKKTFTIFGNDYQTKDGTCIRDYIHVLDLASAHQVALEALFSGAQNQIFNCGTGFGYSNLEVVGALEKILGRSINYQFGPRRPGDPDELVAKVNKIAKHLNWQAKYSDIKTILSSALKWHQTHPKGYE